MAITNAQQYQQLVNKPADGKRPGYRGPGEYQGGTRSSSTSSSSSSKSSSSGGGGGGGNNNNDNQSTARERYITDYSSKGIVKGGGPKIGVDKDGSPVFADAKLTKNQINRAKNFRELQKFKSNLNKPNFTPGIAASLLTKVFPGNLKYRKEFLASNPELLEYFESLSEEDQKSNATMVALADIMNLDGKTYEDFLAYDKGAPGLKYKGDVGNLEKFVSSYEMNPDGTFKLSPKGFKIAKTYDYRERPDNGGGGDNVMSDYERRLLELEKQNAALKNQQNTTTNVANSGLGGLAPRFAGSIFDFTGLADGGRAGMMDGGMMDDDPTGGIMDLETGRQMYFLGKLVKKAKRAVKKVVKSPIGKAALFAAPFLMNPAARAGIGSFFGKGSFNPLRMAAAATSDGPMTQLSPFGKILSKLGMATGEGGGKLTLGGKIGLGFGIPLALDLMGVGKDDDDKMDLDEYYRSQGIDVADIRLNPYNYLAPRFAADGGLMRMGYQEGGDAEPVAKKTMPLIDMDGKEKDYRETGGFVDMGRMERADDVPARLSKNEFVFTADAVRNAGEGDIDKGAEVMYNMMKNLEAGGEVSEESQGLEGARNMFQTSQRLEEVL